VAHYVATITVQRIDPPKPATKDRYGTEETPATFGETVDLGSVTIRDGKLGELITRSRAHLDLITDLKEN